MGNPLKIKETGGGTFLGLQEMTDTEMDYAVHQILTEFSTSTSGEGTVSVGSSGTDMGTFNDTKYTDASQIGDHPGPYNTSTTTYTLRMNLETASETSIIYPLFLNDSGYAAEHSNNLSTVLIDRAISNLVANGLGSYVLSSSNPDSSLYTTTGSTITDSQFSTNTSGSTVYYLFRKTTGVSAPSTTRPAKIYNTSSIREMSDTEIKTLAARLRNRIRTEGIGQYKLSATNPAQTGETWEERGTITDTRYNVTDQSYGASYVGVFNKTYTGVYVGVYQKAYEKQYEGSFNKNYTKSYIGQYSRQITKHYHGAYEGTFTGNYTKQYEGSFTAQYEKAYAGTYTGVYVKQYQGQYEGTFLKQYAGQYSRQFEGAFTKQYEGTFTGYFTDTYSRAFSGAFFRALSGGFSGKFFGVSF